MVSKSFCLIAVLTLVAADWFSQRVEIRIALQMMSMMAELHRINTEVPVMAEKAQRKAPSSTAASAKNL